MNRQTTGIRQFIASIKTIDRSIVILAVIVVLSRLPFLGAGYGNDPDAWRLANNAKTIAATGTYSWSRPPGLPVHEILSALLSPGGPWVLNGATALFSVIAVVCFALSLKSMRIRNYHLAGYLLAFVPGIYIASTELMDYMWALAFLMLGLYMVLTDRNVLAGVFLGLAVGCRLTSGAMVLPLAIILCQQRPDLPWQQTFYRCARFLLSAGVTCLTVFAPVIATYGAGFFTFYDIPSPSIKTAAQKMSFDLWGFLGTYVMGAIIALAVILPRMFCQPDNEARRVWRRYLRPSIIAIVLYVVAFLRLPVEALYLAPMIPFAILLLAGYLKRWVMIVACVSLLVTSYVDFRCSTCFDSLGQGPFLADHGGRSRGVAYVERILEMSTHLPKKSAIVAAWWEPHLRLLRKPDPADSVAYLYCLDQGRLNDWRGKGYAIYHLPGVEEYNKQNYGIDLQEVSTVLNIAY